MQLHKLQDISDDGGSYRYIKNKDYQDQAMVVFPHSAAEVENTFNGETKNRTEVSCAVVLIDDFDELKGAGVLPAPRNLIFTATVLAKVTKAAVGGAFAARLKKHQKGYFYFDELTDEELAVVAPLCEEDKLPAGCKPGETPAEDDGVAKFDDAGDPPF